MKRKLWFVGASAMRAQAAGAWAAVATALALVGCFHHPNLDVENLPCTSDENCPVGSNCDLEKGLCSKPGAAGVDSGSSDGVSVFGAESGASEVQPSVEVSIDVPWAPDGAGNLDGVVAPDVAAGEDGRIGPGGPDVSTYDASLAGASDTPADTPMPDRPASAVETGETDTPIPGSGGISGTGGLTGSGGIAGAGGVVGSGGIVAGAGGTSNAGGTGGSSTTAVIDCGPLANPGNGAVSVSSTTLGSSATYSCAVGYNLSGSTTRTCQADGTWSGTTPTCSPVSCSTLAAPTNGSVSTPATTYGSVATYSCTNGYGPSGSSTRTCQADGTWSGVAPTCVVADCPSLPSPVGGTVSAPTLTYGSTASYTCLVGYTLSGAQTRTCQSDGTWSGSAPTCAIVDCGALANPTNGTVSAATTTFQSTATYSCLAGYNLSGAATRSCEAGGTWSGSAPACAIVDCGAPASPTNGNVTATITTYQSVAHYSCSTGYNLQGSSTRTCQADGYWAGTAPTCAPVDCGAPTVPFNGTVSTTTTTYQSVASYSCVAGYTPANAGTRTCQADGTWSGVLPTCSPVDCGSLAAPPKGSVSAPTTTYPSTATYSCSSGYVLRGSTTRTCQADGTWSGSTPTCVSAGWWPRFGRDLQSTRLSPIDTSSNTGVLKWSFTTGDSVLSSPAIGTDGTVYVGSNDGNLYAISPPASGTTGVLKWSFATGGYVYSSPAIGTDGTVYVGSMDNNLYAISPPASGTTGVLKWSFTTGNPVAYSSPAIGADGTVYVGSEDRNLYAISPPANGTTGVLKWSFTTAGQVFSSPAVGADGTVYVGSSDRNLYAISPPVSGTTGVLKWSFATGNSVYSSPAIGVDGTVYVGSDHKLYAIGPPASGTIGVLKWSFTTGNQVVSSPAIGADGTVYVGSEDGKLYAVGPPASGTAGVLKWSFTTGNQVESSPATGSDGTVYVGSDDNKLYAIGPPASGTTGVLKWSFATGNLVYSSPAIGADGTVYIASDDSSVYAIH